ncbi:hypothetical protein CspHIS471_0500060 [Cutaneotrichosporon sp. HIS471]|nr:hypothetical protein CspHIS471_0500060 [Cutaneotrichosporon sp. HIS471]
MPKAPRGLSSGAQPRRSTRAAPVADPPTLPPHPATQPQLPLCPIVPAWVRRDWSDTPLCMPSFVGATCPAMQLDWAARNASVAIHDVYTYNGGAWDTVRDRSLCVYLAVCDVVLQKKRQASNDLGDDPLPPYRMWLAARKDDVRGVFALAQRDFVPLGISLHYGAAYSLALAALQLVYEEDYDAEGGPTIEDEYPPLDVRAFGEFRPRADNIARHGLLVWRTSVGNDSNEGGVNGELRAWTETHGPLDGMFSALASLKGLPPFPPGTRPPPLPPAADCAGWTVSVLEDPPEFDCPLPSLAQLCTPSR